MLILLPFVVGLVIIIPLIRDQKNDKNDTEDLNEPSYLSIPASILGIPSLGYLFYLILSQLHFYNRLFEK